MVRINIILESIGTAKKVLDVGCYDGTISALIKQLGNNVFGIDVSEKAVEIARERGIDARVWDLDNRLPFPDESFDVVVAGEVIEHVREIDFLVQEFWRVLRRPGYAVVTTPNLASLGRRLLLLFGRNPLTETRWTPGSAGHVRYFVKDSLFELFESHDFHVSNFSSDVVNFDNTGQRFSTRLARLFPTSGRSLILKATKAG